MLPPEQIENIKKQLLSQLETSNLPNAEEIKKSILKMNPEELEQFLIQNKLIKDDAASANESERMGTSTPSDASASQGDTLPTHSPQQQCIFCSIVSGNIPTNKIDENKDSIAVLEINPASYGHSLIIPKKHIESSSKLPQTAFSLAKKISKKIKTKLKPKEVLISSANVFGHEIINILPVYENETLNSQRQQAKPEDLAKLQKLLGKKTKPKQIKKQKTKKIKDNKLIIPKRIP